MPREFDFLQMKHLKEICKSDKKIIVSGINSRGVPFAVEGKIARDNNDRPGFGEDGLAIEFGKVRSPYSNKPLWTAVYFLNIDKGIWRNNLIVESIKDENGNLIYSAQNFDEIKNIAEQNKIAYQNHNKAYLIHHKDVVTEKLEGLVGHPIMLDGIAGVLTAVDLIDEMGQACAKVTSIDNDVVLAVKNNSVLETADENGNRLLVVKNDPYTATAIAKENEQQLDLLKNSERQI